MGKVKQCRMQYFVYIAAQGKVLSEYRPYFAVFAQFFPFKAAIKQFKTLAAFTASARTLNKLFGL